MSINTKLDKELFKNWPNDSKNESEPISVRSTTRPEKNLIRQLSINLKNLAISHKKYNSQSGFLNGYRYDSPEYGEATPRFLKFRSRRSHDGSRDLGNNLLLRNVPTVPLIHYLNYNIFSIRTPWRYISKERTLRNNVDEVLSFFKLFQKLSTEYYKHINYAPKPEGEDVQEYQFLVRFYNAVYSQVAILFQQVPSEAGSVVQGEPMSPRPERAESNKDVVFINNKYYDIKRFGLDSRHMNYQKYVVFDLSDDKYALKDVFANEFNHQIVDLRMNEHFIPTFAYILHVCSAVVFWIKFDTLDKFCVINYTNINFNVLLIFSCLMLTVDDGVNSLNEIQHRLLNTLRWRQCCNSAPAPQDPGNSESARSLNSAVPMMFPIITWPPSYKRYLAYYFNAIGRVNEPLFQGLNGRARDGPVEQLDHEDMNYVAAECRNVKIAERKAFRLENIILINSLLPKNRIDIEIYRLDGHLSGAKSSFYEYLNETDRRPETPPSSSGPADASKVVNNKCKHYESIMFKRRKCTCYRPRGAETEAAEVTLLACPYNYNTKTIINSKRHEDQVDNVIYYYNNAGGADPDDGEVVLEGDVTIVFVVDILNLGRTHVASYSFNTSFVDSTSVELTKEDLDIWDQKCPILSNSKILINLTRTHLPKNGTPDIANAHAPPDWYHFSRNGSVMNFIDNHIKQINEEELGELMRLTEHNLETCVLALKLCDSFSESINLLLQLKRPYHQNYYYNDIANQFYNNADGVETPGRGGQEGDLLGDGDGEGGLGPGPGEGLDGSTKLNGDGGSGAGGSPQLEPEDLMRVLNYADENKLTLDGGDPLGGTAGMDPNLMNENLMKLLSFMSDYVLVHRDNVFDMDLLKSLQGGKENGSDGSGDGAGTVKKGGHSGSSSPQLGPGVGAGLGAGPGPAKELLVTTKLDIALSPTSGEKEPPKEPPPKAAAPPVPKGPKVAKAPKAPKMGKKAPPLPKLPVRTVKRVLPLGVKLHWKPLLGSKLANTIFATFDSAGLLVSGDGSGDLIDITNIKRLFSRSGRSKSMSSYGSSNSDSIDNQDQDGEGKPEAKKRKKKNKIDVLDNKRAQNVLIILRFNGMGHYLSILNEVENLSVLHFLMAFYDNPVRSEDARLQGLSEEEKLVEDIKENINKLYLSYPTDNESEQLLASYEALNREEAKEDEEEPEEPLPEGEEGDRAWKMSRYRVVERMLLEMLLRECMWGKINLIRCYIDLEQHLAVVKEQLSAYEAAIVDVKENKVLPLILNIILQYGNFVNYGSITEGEKGFTLSSTIKLIDFKSSDNTLSSLHYLIINLYIKILRACPPQSETAAGGGSETDDLGSSLLNLDKELKSVLLAEKISSKGINDVLQDLSNQLLTVISIFNKADSDAAGAQPREAVDATITIGRQKLNEVFEDKGRVFKQLKDIWMYLGEDLGSAPKGGGGEGELERIFKILGELIKCIRKVFDDVRRKPTKYLMVLSKPKDQELFLRSFMDPKALANYYKSLPPPAPT